MMPLVIVDFHTHVFPPQVRDNREEYLRRDPTFAEMYGSPKAEVATADDLLSSMEEAGVDVSVALGFAWRDHEECARHNDYLLEAAAASGGRLVPFCTVNPLAGEAAAREIERCARAGARGLGELRPDSQGWPLEGEPGDALLELAARHGLVLLFHVTEPAGREYPGKRGLTLESFYRFAEGAGGIPIIGAHLAGGLPLYAPIPAARRALSTAYMDTAALRYLYAPSTLAEVVRSAGAERLLFGSDYPLVSQSAAMADIGAAGLDDHALRAVLGENGARLLSL